MKKSLRFLANTILNFLYPVACVSCSKPNAFLCHACLARIPSLEHQKIDVFGLNVCRAIVDFHHQTVQHAIHLLKYEGITGLAAPLATILLRANITPFDMIIPVPLHKRKQKIRGYNQNALLAKELFSPQQIRTDILIRHRHTKPQIQLEPGERVQNVDRAFSVKKASDVLGKHILLLDDVITTGSTLSACAQPLREAGAASVSGLVLARA